MEFFPSVPERAKEKSGLPIPEHEALNVVIGFSASPSVNTEEGLIYATVQIDNRSRHRLTGTGPLPFNLAAFIVPATAERPFRNPPRYPDEIDIAAHSTAQLKVAVSLPDRPGRYILAVTLVQEGVRWLHVPPLAQVAEFEFDWAGHPRWWADTQESNVVYGNVESLNQRRLSRYLSCGDLKRPLLLHLETINICNLLCRICAYPKMTRRKQTMDMDMFEKVISHYEMMGGGDLALTPSVGDVFLDKLLVTRMRYLTSRTLINNIGFVTNAGNAGVFDDDDLRNIVAPCSRINISVYGLDEEETEAMTRRRGFYLKALPQYQRILATRSKYTKIGFSFRLLKPDANERAVRWMLDNFGQVYGHEVLTAFGNWAGAIDTQDPLPFSGVWRSPGEASENETPCAYPVLHIKVAVNGDVKFCSCVDYDSNPENIIGNVRDDNLLAIYNGHRAASLWRHGLSMCVGCTHRVDIPMITSQYAKLSSVISELGV